MTRYIIKISMLFVAFTSLISCERKDSHVANPDTAGKGGTAILKITPQHHGKNIDSATIYIKYNTQNLPATYDDSVKCVMENGKPVATFTQLKKGKYYIYGRGWEPAISAYANGGIPYTITEEKTHEITVPITEGD